MSTSQQRLKAAIRRIAKSDPEIRSLLRTLEARGGIPRSGASASNDSERDKTCCDGSTPDGDDDGTVGTDTQNPSDGGQDGLNPDDPADLGDMGPGELGGLTNCETGEPVCFGGSFFEAPEGWADPSSPPINPDWEEGVYWTVDWSVTEDGTRIDEGVDYYAAKPNICGYAPCSDKFDCSDDTTLFGTGCDDGRAYSATRNPKGCDENAPAGVCTSEPPRLESWPEDGCANLISTSGKLVGSKYDPENDGSYSAPRDEIELCDEEGNQVNIKPSGSTAGGWKSINPAVDGGDGYLYDGSGKQIARISGSEYSDPNI